VTADEIRSFCSRDWNAIERVKSDFWREQKQVTSPSGLLRLAGELYEYARALRPDWPNDAEREDDLRSHIRVAGMLQRAGKAKAY
jgi:hypothetical protein